MILILINKMYKYLNIAIGLILFICFQQLAYSSFVKVYQDKSLVQSGYIATISQSGVQAMAINKENTRLFSVYKAGESYCLNITRLSYSINITDTFNKCFDSTAMLGNKVTGMIFSDSGKAFYLFSKHDIVAYKISPITDTIKAKMFSERLDSKIIEEKISDDHKYIFVLGENKESRGVLFIYRINQDGSLARTYKKYLGYKPGELRSDEEHIYVSSQNGIYRYTLDLQGFIGTSEEIIHLKKGRIESYDLIQKSTTNVDILVAIRDIDSEHNKESGIVRQYDVGADNTRMVYQKFSIEVPKKVLLYRSKDGSVESSLIVYDTMYTLLDANHEIIKSASFASFKNVYKYKNLGLISFENDLDSNVSKGAMMFLDLAGLGRVAGDFHTSELPKVSLFKSDKFYAVSTNKGIDIFQLAVFIN